MQLSFLRIFVFLCFPAAAFAGNRPADIDRDHHFPWEKNIGYTQVVRVDNTLYLSGITSGKTSLAEQLEDVYSVMAKVLKTYDATLGDIVKETIYTTDIEGLKSLTGTRKSLFPGGAYPASTWVQVEQLYAPAMQVEIEAIVVLRNPPPMARDTQN